MVTSPFWPSMKNIMGLRCSTALLIGWLETFEIFWRLETNGIGSSSGSVDTPGYTLNYLQPVIIFPSHAHQHWFDALSIVELWFSMFSQCKLSSVFGCQTHSKAGWSSKPGEFEASLEGFAASVTTLASIKVEKKQSIYNNFLDLYRIC